MKKTILIIIALLCISFVFAGDPYIIDENMEMLNNDIYNASNVNSTNFYQNGSKVLDTDDINGTKFNYSFYANESLYWGGETSQANLNVNRSDYWDNYDTPAGFSWSGDLSGSGLSPSVVNDSHNHSNPTISNVNGTKIRNMDLSCGSDTYFTILNFTEESGTCTGISDVYLLNTGDDASTYEYNFSKVSVTNLEADNLESNLDGTGYNITGSWLLGIFNWIISTTSYLTFNGTELDFNETLLNRTIKDIDTNDTITVDFLVTENQTLHREVDSLPNLSLSDVSINIGNFSAWDNNSNKSNFWDEHNVASDLDNKIQSSAENISAGTFGAGNYTIDGNLTVEEIRWEQNSTFRDYANSTCRIIMGATSTLTIC